MTELDPRLEVAEEVRALRSELLALAELVREAPTLPELQVDALLQAASAEQALLEEELEALMGEFASLQSHHAGLLESLEADHHHLDQHMRQMTEHLVQRRIAFEQSGHHSRDALQGARHRTEAEPPRLRQAQQSARTVHLQLASDLENRHHRSRQALQETRHHSEQHARDLGYQAESALHRWQQDGSFLEGQLGDLEQRLSSGTERLREMAEQAIAGQVQAVVAEGLHALEGAVEDSLHRLSQDAGELGAVRAALTPLVEELGHLFHPLKEHSDHVHYRAAELGVH